MTDEHNPAEDRQRFPADDEPTEPLEAPVDEDTGDEAEPGEELESDPYSG